jgi:Predicted pPIWI-associating nuclease
MPRRVTPAQFRNMVRQEEGRRRQAINKYNAAVRKYNSEVKRAVDSQNAAARKTKQEIDKYNRAARAHNARVRADHQRLQREVERINRQKSTTRFVVEQESSLSLHHAFRRLDTEADQDDWGAHGNRLVDLAETEAANSVAVTNTLLDQGDAPQFESTELSNELKVISPDLDSRWQGALFSINPHNPDAARHFCTSAREIITQMIDLNAPDDVVREEIDGCQLTNDGRPVRREKIGYLLKRSATDHESLTSFVDTDVDDVVGLFSGPPPLLRTRLIRSALLLSSFD